MSTATVALVAAILALAGTLVTNVVALVNERNRQREARHLEYTKELRARTAEAFRYLLALQHSMEWVTWHATRDAAGFTPDARTTYNAEMHAAFPAFPGALAAVTALDRSMHDRLRPLLSKVYALDEQISIALIRLDSPDKHDQARSDLASYYRSAAAWADEFPDQLASAIDATR